METVSAYDAKTHLPKLLDRVQKGERITITRHGTPVAELVPVVGRPKMTAKEAIAGLKDFSKGRRLGDISIKELIEEGRR